MLKIIFWYDYFQIDLHKDKFLRVRVPIELFPVLGSNTYIYLLFLKQGPSSFYNTTITTNSSPSFNSSLISVGH